MSPLSVGFLCLFGIETAVICALLYSAHHDHSLSLRRSAQVMYVIGSSCLVNTSYLIVWFLQVKAEDILK